MKHCLKIAATIIMLISTTGCSTASRIVSYAHTNPIVVNVATRQAVARYVNAGETHSDKLDRAKKVESVIRNVETFLEGNPTASAKTVFLVLKANVNLDSLSITDRLLVDDIFAVVENNLSNNQQAGLLPPDSVIRIRVLLRTLMQTAAMFK